MAARSVLQSMSRLLRSADVATEAWIGWSWPPAERAIEAAAWSPDGCDAYCRRCGESVGPGEGSEKGCPRCRRRRLPFDRFVRLGRYETPLREWICDAKYRDWPEMDAALGARLGAAVRDLRELDVASTIVVPVPMPWQRRLFRGLDHARVIADAVACELKTEVHQLLRKTNDIPQAVLSATERKRTRDRWIRPRRILLRGRKRALEGLDVVLVDDVRTTGATLSVSAGLLKQAGAGRIVAAVLAVADEPGRRSPAAAVDAEISLKSGVPRAASDAVIPQSIQGSRGSGDGVSCAAPERASEP